METVSFGRWLRDRIRMRELSAAELARRIDVGAGTVSRWLNGSRQPSWDMCYALADALDLPPNHVLAAAGHQTDGDVDKGNEAEDRLVAMWRRLTPEGQAAVLAFTAFQRTEERRQA